MTVTEGVGITTDGDLLICRGVLCRQVQAYNDSNPKYDLFFSGEKMNGLPTHGEVRGETDAAAKILSRLRGDKHVTR